MLTATW